MRVLQFGRLLLGTAAPALLLLARPVTAQQAVISGRVTSEAGEPLGGASVAITNTSLGAATAANGTYTLTVPAEMVRGQQVGLVARRIGFRPSTRAITLTSGSQEQNFTLATDPLRLEEVVVTGVGEATARNKLTFSAATVSAEQLQEVPGTSALVALQGKVAGVRLTPTSAQPGGEVAIRLRGATSISGRQDPLFIVDGVITPFGLADIAPEDVERVEVIKGAAASSLYGSNAANGVVQVFTKRGRGLPEGTLRFTTRLEAGWNEFPKAMRFSRSHVWEIEPSQFGLSGPSCQQKNSTWTVDPVGGYCLNAQGGRIVKADQIADNPFKVWYNHWDTVVDEGMFWTGYVSVGQRRGTTNFNASVQNTRNEGVIFGLGGYRRQNFRLNLDQQLRSNVDASFSAFYATSTNGRTEEGQTGPFFGLMFLQPDVDITAPNPDGSPYRAQVPLSGDVANDFNPLYELAYRQMSQDRNRFTGSGRLRWRILDWLSTEGSFAYDREGQDSSDVRPFGYLTSEGSETDGRLVRASRNNWQYNTGLTLTSVRTFLGDITNTTKVGITYEAQQNRWIRPEADALVVAGVDHFRAVDPASLRAESEEQDFRTQNYLAITTFDIKDRYILDGLVRRDGSSLFGPENRWANYYRVSGAWRVTQDFTIPGIDELRLRSSYGTAGLRPQFEYQYEVLEVQPGGGFSKETLGNRLLKPAHSAELEAGANLEFGGGRFTLEYSYAQKTTSDQILLVDLPAAVGFKQQWQNTGELQAKTHEAAFGAQLIDRPGLSLTVNIVGDRTRQVITEWDLPERLYSFQQMPAAFFLGRGSDLGVLYGNRWVRTIEELYDDPAKAAARGPGQAHSPDKYIVNEDGYVVRAADYGTINERAIKYTFCKRRGEGGNCLETSQTVEIGNANPDFNLSFNATLNWRRFVVTGLLDWSHGGDLYNGTRQWAFQATRDRVQDQGGKPDAARKALAYYAVGFYNGLDPNDFFVEDGSYAKLKELSVNYTFVRDQLDRIGLLRGMQDLKVGFIGRNLFTITDYSGLDPEVSGLFGDPFQVKMDWFQYPQFRTYSVFAEITF
jgi:TonB-linked SusC/RagA family outer membrane protein